MHISVAINYINKSKKKIGVDEREQAVCLYYNNGGKNRLNWMLVGLNIDTHTLIYSIDFLSQLSSPTL